MISGIGDIRLKSPRDPREMWKKLDMGDNKSDSDGPEIVTKVRQVLDFEIFETDAPDVDFDEINDREAESSANRPDDSKEQEKLQLVAGVDLIIDDISTSKAYQYFSQLEVQGLGFKPPAQLAEAGNSRFEPELTSAKIKRLAAELEQIQAEL